MASTNPSTIGKREKSHPHPSTGGDSTSETTRHPSQIDNLQHCGQIVPTTTYTKANKGMTSTMLLDAYIPVEAEESIAYL